MSMHTPKPVMTAKYSEKSKKQPPIENHMNAKTEV